MKYELILKIPQGKDGPAIGEDTAFEAIGLLERGADLADIARLVRPAAQQASEGTEAGAQALQKSPGEPPRPRPLDGQSALNQLSLDDKPLSAKLAKAEDGQLSIELSISFELKEGAFDEVFGRAAGFAEVLGAVVTDPQLMQDITAASKGQVSAKWSQMRDYLLRASGRSALLESTSAPLTMPAPTFFERHWKGIFIGIGALLLLMFVRRAIEVLFGGS